MSVAALLDDPSPSASQSALKRLRDLVADDIERVDQVIIDHLASRVPLIPRLAGHLVHSGGKRLRPILTLTSARMCGYRGDRHIRLAACVEFIHNATLLHDDVVDDSVRRHGLASANAVWGNKPSVLVGDFLLSRSFQLMVADGSARVLEILADASAMIAEGEVHQLMLAKDIPGDEADHMKVIEAKTATLIRGAASEVGAVVAARPREEQEALKAHGMALGIAFQLVDDVLDYSAREAELGKTVGDDFPRGQDHPCPWSMPSRAADAEQRAFWKRTIEDGDRREGDPGPRHGTRPALRGALDETMALARAPWRHRACRALDPFPVSPWRRALLDLGRFLRRTGVLTAGRRRSRSARAAVAALEAGRYKPGIATPECSSAW